MANGDKVEIIIKVAAELRKQYTQFAGIHEAALKSDDMETADRAMWALEVLNHAILAVYRIGVEVLNNGS